MSPTRSYVAGKKNRRGSGGILSKIMVFDIFDKCGIENCKIELLELFPCSSNDELTAKEGYFIKTLRCVNKNIPGRNQKEYREDNKEQIKQYRKDNKEKMKQYCAQNKEHISEQQKQLVTCACGSSVRKGSMSRHCKTIKHINFINSE
jgi:hypothetical protein